MQTQVRTTFRGTAKVRNGAGYPEATVAGAATVPEATVPEATVAGAATVPDVTAPGTAVPGAATVPGTGSSRAVTKFRGAAAILLAAALVGACNAKASPTPGGSDAGSLGSAGPNASGGAASSGGLGGNESFGPGGSGGAGGGLNPSPGSGGSGGGAGGIGPGPGGTGGGSGSVNSAALGQLEQAYEAVVEKVSPSVVVIETSEGLGSGIVFDAKGNIVTNAHVVGSATQFRVTLSDGSQLPATLVGTYPANDIAVIHVNPADAVRPGTGPGAGAGTSPAPNASGAPGTSSGPNPTGTEPAATPSEGASAGSTLGTGGPESASPTFPSASTQPGVGGSSAPAASASAPASASSVAPGAGATVKPGGSAAPTTTSAGLVPATFGDSGRLRVGQIVLAVGNPLGLQSSVTNGIVSSLGRTVTEPGGATLPGMIQTSAAINPGNSGGALVDINGNVVGIPTLAASDPQIGGAAPGIGFAIPANDAKDFANQLIASGHVTNTHRAYLGIRSADVNVDAVLVYGLDPNGPAAAAGIQAGDLIVAVDGKATPSAADLSAILARLQPSQTVSVDVVRQDGSKASIRVTLGQLPG